MQGSQVLQRRNRKVYGTVERVASPDDAGPGRHKDLAHELRQVALPLRPLHVIGLRRNTRHAIVRAVCDHCMGAENLCCAAGSGCGGVCFQFSKFSI